MPKDNIERAIKKGAGRGSGEGLFERMYEAYGPGGAAILILSVTDNPNRTVAEIKHILSRHGASLSGEGSVRWLFTENFRVGENAKEGSEEKDIFFIPKSSFTLSDADARKLSALLSELKENEDVSEVYTNTQ
jgi:transcriptional/translational regulatory protein YebC/TACO1